MALLKYRTRPGLSMEIDEHKWKPRKSSLLELPQSTNTQVVARRARASHWCRTTCSWHGHQSLFRLQLHGDSPTSRVNNRVM